MKKSYSQLRILVVEDLEANRAVAVFYLKKLGCSIWTAENGIAALELCRNNPFDLVFMDLEMPEMNGMEAMKRLKKEETPNKHTPVIGLTANEEKKKVESCLNLGFRQMLNKPFKSADLKDALNRWIA